MRSFQEEMIRTFASGRHVILHRNTEDRVYPEESDGPPMNVEFTVAADFAAQGFRIVTMTPSQGIRELDPQDGSCKTMSNAPAGGDPLAMINFAANLLTKPNEKWLLIIKHPEMLLPNREHGNGASSDILAFMEAVHSMGLNDQIMAGQSRLVLETFNGIPDRLIAESRGFGLVEIGLPDEEERRRFIEFLIGQGIGSLKQGISIGRAARLTKGMPLSAVEGTFRVAQFLGRPVSARQISKAKAAAISHMAGDRLQVIEPTERLTDLAGLHAWRAFIRELVQLIHMGSKQITTGIMEQGVPGTAKTISARALAGELGIPLVMMRNIRGPYVGETEANLEIVLSLIRTLAPVVVFMDEIDQLIGQRQTGASGDSGTGARMMARLFEFMADPELRGQVLFVAATNRPDLIDSALVSRFGVSIPFLRPGPEEIREMIPKFLKRFDRQLGDADVEELAATVQPLSLTGRDIQELLIHAGHLADAEAGGLGAPLQHKHLLMASRDQISRDDPREMQFLELVSLSMANRQSLLPWNGPDGLREGATIPEWLLETGVVGADGYLDKVRTHEVLTQMKHERFNARMIN